MSEAGSWGGETVCEEQEQVQDKPSKPLLGGRVSRAGILGLPCLLIDTGHRFNRDHLLIAVVVPQCSRRSGFVCDGGGVGRGPALALALIVAGGRRRAIVGALVRLDAHFGGV